MNSNGIQHVSSNSLTALALGLVGAVAIHCFPVVTAFILPLLTLVHEIGHAIAGWIFGYPSIPTFDFNYGGGLTLSFERSGLVLLVVYLAMASWLYRSRRRVAGWVTVLALIAIYSVLALTGVEQVIVLFMGHGAELIFAAICFYRVLSGRSLATEAERPLYAFVGFFINLQDLRFGWGLISGDGSRVDYEEGKGDGAMMNDFSRIADEFWHVDLSVVVKFFLLLCLLPPILSFLYYRYHPMIMTLLWDCFGPPAPSGMDADGPSLGGVRELPPLPASVAERTIFLLIDGRRRGPYTRSAVRSMIKVGNVSRNTLCWEKGMDDWRSLSETMLVL